MTTNTTSTASQAPAVSIDTTEFNNLLVEFVDSAAKGIRAYHAAGKALIAYINAQMVKDHNRGYAAGYAAMEARATAAEAKLEAIRQGVEDLLQYILDHDWGGIPEPVPQIAALRAIFQPQPQADREAEQRKRIQERFANRPKTPATADFDLPYASNSDGPDYSKADESGLPG